MRFVKRQEVRSPFAFKDAKNVDTTQEDDPLDAGS